MAAPPMSQAASRRIAIVAADAARLVHLRLPLVKALVSGGHKLLCLTGTAKPEDKVALTSHGAETATFPLGVHRAWLPGRGRASEPLTAQLSDWRPNVAIAIGRNPILTTAAAARKAQVPRVVLVASSLAGITQDGRERPGFGTRWLLRRALAHADVLVVHNRDDERRLRELDLVPAAMNVRTIPGAGVDLAYHPPTPLPALDRGLVFVMVARRDRTAGIFEFCKAARHLKTKAPGARFVLATRPGEGASAVAAKELQAFGDVVELQDAADDVRPVIGSCHVFVYPSYGEGIAQEVLQALASGRPVITTDSPGCRDTVDERVSGVLVPPRDAAALTTAMESFLRRPDLIPWMSQAARTKAERRFDANVAAAELIGLLGLEQGR